MHDKVAVENFIHASLFQKKIYVPAQAIIRGKLAYKLINEPFFFFCKFVVAEQNTVVHTEFRVVFYQFVFEFQLQNGYGFRHFS